MPLESDLRAMADSGVPMMHQAGIRQWLVVAVLFWAVGLLFGGLPVVAQQTQSASIEGEPAALL